MMIKVKDWFLEKNYSQNEAYAIRLCDNCNIERETEKAALIRFETEWGLIKGWFPKSVYEVEAEGAREHEEAAINFQVGDRVVHARFGSGVVQAVDGQAVTVKMGRKVKRFMGWALEKEGA